MSCSVVNCPSIPGKDLSFFNFPDPNSQECKVWVKFCGRDDDWRIKRGYQICELHFRHSDKTGELSKKSLKDGALPEHSTLCPFIESSCRVCLTEIPTGLVPLFSTFIDDVAVGGILEYCTSVEIRPTDSFPKFICQECLMKMENAKEFKDLTLKTDGKLRNHFLFVQDIIAQKQISVVKQEKDLEEQIITEVFLDAENVHDLEEVFIKLEASPAKQTEDKSIEKPRKKYTYKNKAEENYCPKCDKDFDTTSEFKLHKQQHLKEAQRKKHKLNYKSTKKIQFFCSTCNKGFTTKTELIKHKKEHATLSKIKVVKAVKAKVNYCSKCNKDFDTTSEIKLHRQQHVKENKSKNHKLHYKPKRKIQFFCSTCNQGFTTKKGLRKHKREHVTPHVEPENCLLCGIEFEYPTVLIKHLANDHLTDNLECSQCKKKFRFAISLFRHLKEHLNPGKNLNFFCQHCGKGFYDNNFMKRHARKHRIELSKCDLCGIETKYKSTLRRHMSAVHLHEARYQCNICGKFFTTNGLMVIHQVNHHNVETPFKCDVCNRGFPMEHFLNSHKERNAMFIDLCKGQPAELTMGKKRRHRFSRNPETIKGVKKVDNGYKCEICGLQFEQKVGIHKHMRNHYESKKFPCDLCSKRFLDSTGLEVHKRMHARIKSFKCPNCDKNFVNVSALMKHLKTVHKIEKPSPEMILK